MDFVRDGNQGSRPTLSPSSAAGTRAEGAASPDIEQVYHEHHDFVWRTILRFGIPPAQADDAVQEVFIAAARRLSEFEGRSSMSTWLFAIAMRVAQRLRRDEARHRRRVEAYERSEPDATSEPHARSEAAQLLHRLLDRLDDDRRAVFILAELEGMTAPEIAEALGVKLPTVYTRLRAARILMSEALAAETGGEAPR
jgi:RNA polymerase sigma-70 factor, ECF subfamily